MDIDAFWRLNENLPIETATKALKKRLSGLSPDDLASYQAHFDTCHEAAYRWSIWGAAHIMCGGGCSDDSFIDFRYGLISRGRAVFEAAIADADSLVDVEEGQRVRNELFGYVALELYEAKTGCEIPRQKFANVPPSGQRWDFEDAAENERRLPAVWQRFRGTVFDASVTWPRRRPGRH